MIDGSYMNAPVTCLDGTEYRTGVVIELLSDGLIADFGDTNIILMERDELKIWICGPNGELSLKSARALLK